MLVGVIADDFTGASDIANTLAKGCLPHGGINTAQYIGVPNQDAESLAALVWLKAQGCLQIIFKYCSTFDSTPDGNIGPVGEALAEALGAKGVVVCPAFPDAGRTVYQAHLFVFDKLLHESGMQEHPINPMTEPDLRRCLEQQSQGSVGHAPHAAVRAGGSVLRG